MELGEAIELINEQGKDAPVAANQIAFTALYINDGTCADCGPYRLTRYGKCVHPFECENTERHDHNVTGFRKFIEKERLYCVKDECGR